MMNYGCCAILLLAKSVACDVFSFL